MEVVADRDDLGQSSLLSLIFDKSTDIFNDLASVYKVYRQSFSLAVRIL